METLSLSKSTTYQMTSRRRPHSVLSSATAVDPRRSVQTFRAMTKSDCKSSSKHAPMMSSTYMSTRLCRTCDNSHVIALVTTWKAAGVHAQPNIPAIWRYTKIVRRPQGKKRAECTLPINPFSRGLCLPIWSWGHGQVPVAKRS